MKPLLPTLKEKKRYIVYQVISKENIRESYRDVESKLSEILGVFDSAEAGLQNVKWNSKKRIGILRTNNRLLKTVKAAMIMIKSLNDTPCFIKVLGVSGILKKTSRFV